MPCDTMAQAPRWLFQRVWVSRWLVLLTLINGAQIFGFPDTWVSMRFRVTDLAGFFNAWTLTKQTLIGVK